MTEATLLGVRHDEIDGVAVVYLTGEVDLSNAHVIQDALASTTSPAVVLDATDLAYVDSAGVRAMDLGYRRLASEERTLLIVAPLDSRADWTFRVAGFDDDLVVESFDAALAAIRSRGQPS